MILFVNYYNGGSPSLLFVVVRDVTITIFITACNLERVKRRSVYSLQLSSHLVT